MAIYAYFEWQKPTLAEMPPDPNQQWQQAGVPADPNQQSYAGQDDPGDAQPSIQAQQKAQHDYTLQPGANHTPEFIEAVKRALASTGLGAPPPQPEPEQRAKTAPDIDHIWDAVRSIAKGQ